MNFLIIGLGSMGKRRARLLAGLGARLFGVDGQPSRLEEAAALGVTGFPSLREALAAPTANETFQADGTPTYDAAFVCTAPLSHSAIIHELLDAGLPVFTELNLVADGYEELMAKAKTKKIPMFLSNTMLYRGETKHIREAVADFGKPVNYIYHIGQYLPDWHPWEDYKNFFVGEKRTGGVREILGIDLPWLFETFGPVESFSAASRTLSALGLPYPDSLSLTLRHQSGAIGMLAADVVSPKAVRTFEAFGEGLHLFWEGNPKALWSYDLEIKEKQPIDIYQSYEQDARYSDNIVENAYLDEILNFLAVLQGREKPLWSFEKDREVIRLMDAIERTWEEGS